MSANVYNVIWADDECATLENDGTIRKLFDEKNIEVLKYVPTSEALKDAIECYKDKIDAVIVDGNFPKGNVVYVEPDDISGLIHTISFIELYNAKRDIPFFLYTAKKGFLDNKCKNGELDYFIKLDRYIQKGNVSDLVEKIIEDVDHIHSVEFMVKKKYQYLINMASKIDLQCGENLHQLLLDEARDMKYNKSDGLFNQLRGILEKIMVGCKKNDIIPNDIKALNQFKRFYAYRTHWDRNISKNVGEWMGVDFNGIQYKPKDDIMPIPLGYSIEKLVDITQDGSHKSDGLDLNVSDYTIKAQSPFLFRACLYLVMDILRWYNEIIEKLQNQDLKPPLYESNPISRR